MKTVLKVDHVSISYKIGDFRDIGLKEWTMRHLKKNYHVETFLAVNDVTFELKEGDLLGIVGALLLGVGMCMSMVWSNMVLGIVLGLFGIIALLCLIPLTRGLK